MELECILDNEYCLSSLHCALQNPNCKVDVIKQFLNRGVDVFSVDTWGMSPLHLAILNNCSFDVIKLLLNHGVRQAAVDNESRQSPFLCALQNPNCKADVIKLFLDQGVYLSSMDRCGQTPLHLAVTFSSYDVIKLLLNHGARPDVVDNKYGQSPLFFALKNKRKANIIKLFLDQGVDVSAVGTQGVTPLHLAALNNCSLEVIKLLLDHRARTDVVEDEKKQSVLHCILQNPNCKVDVIKLLLDKGADINLRCTAGFTPLHYAILNPNIKRDVIQLLFDREADVNAEDKSYRSPLYHTVANCYRDAMKLLLDFGALIYNNCDSSVWNLVLEDLDFDNEAFYDCLKLLIKYTVLENSGFQIDEYINIKEHSPHDLRITHFVNECKDELRRMGSVIIFDGISMHEFLSRQLQMETNGMIVTSKPKPRIEFVLDNILSIVTHNDYPIYQEVILGELREEFLMNKLYQQPMFTVSRSLNQSNQTVVLDYDSACIVTKYVSHDDLINLILAFHTHDDCSICSNTCYL